MMNGMHKRECLRQVVLLLFALINTQMVQGQRICPKGYFVWRKTTCFKVSSRTALRTWRSAQDVCAKEGGSLASVHSKAEMNFVRVLMMSGRAKEIYIGVTRDPNAEDFSNSDESQFDFANWRSFNLATKREQQCVVVTSQSKYKWTPVDCIRARRYICKLTPTTVVRRNRQRCYVCKNARTNEECNANGFQECINTELSCQNEIRIQGGVKTISKQCKQPQACENNFLQNPQAAWYPTQCSPSFTANSVCRCCCKGDLCNAAELPCLEDNDCPAIPVPQHALISCSNEYRPNSDCSFSCQPGYRLIGASQTRCDVVTRSWTNQSPRCEKIQCSDRGGEFPNGQVECTDGRNFASRCTYTCNGNYTLRGRETTVCHATGRWTSPIPTCQLIRCPDITRLRNGQVLNNKPPVIGVFRLFRCDEGYFVQGSNLTRCFDSDNDGRGEWSNETPTCQLILCPDPFAPPNGTLELTSLPIFDAVLQFACDVGHFLVGDTTSRCSDVNNDGVGEWSAPFPQCPEILCYALLPPDNGRLFNPKRRNFGSTVDVICDEGYFLIGDDVITCVDQNRDGEGDWDKELPVCQEIVCPELLAPPNGNVTLTASTSHGSVASFSCGVGYFLSNDVPRRCGDVNEDGIGEWSDVTPSCERITCPLLSEPPSGKFATLFTSSFGSNVRVVCDEGFFNFAESSLICTDINNDGVGEWDLPLPECTQITCPVLSSPPNAKFAARFASNFGSNVRVVCDEGFFNFAESSLICTDSNGDGIGEWDFPLPSCTQILCLEEVVVPFNGHIVSIPDDLAYGSAAVLGCNEGYFPLGIPSSVCGDVNKDGVGDWMEYNLICQLISCPVISPPANGQFASLDSLEFGSKVIMACNDGFHMQGGAILSCQDSNGDGEGEWNGTVASCSRIVCSEIAAPRNGVIVTSSPPYWGNSLTFACDEGYFLIGNDVILCTDTDKNGIGDWDSLAPVCNAITCPALPSPSNGVTQLPSNRYGSVASITCDPGFFLIGARQISCVDSNSDGNGEWNQPLPTCKQINCPQIEPPANGISVGGIQTTWGSTVVFQCNAEYFLNGTSSLRCVDEQDDGVGEWDGQVPVCQVIRCPAPSDPENGYFELSDLRREIGTKLTIICDQGFFDYSLSPPICQGNGDSPVGSWSLDLPTCQMITCDTPLSPPEGGELICTEDNFYGSQCLFSCFEGFHLKGNSSLICEDQDFDGKGNWNGESPTCQQILCSPALLPPVSGNLTCSDGNRYASACRYQCQVGFHLAGSEEVTCIDDDSDGAGEWSGAPPICQQITCEVRLAPDDGSVVCTDGEVYGSECKFECDVGHSLVGSDTAQCGQPVVETRGQWNDKTKPVCQVNLCEESSKAPVNGSVSCSRGNEYHSECEYACDVGYRLLGTGSRRCGADKSWSSEQPTCQLIRCAPSPSNPTDGLVFCTEEDRFGSICNYFCDLGFELVGEGRTECGPDTDGDGSGEFDKVPGTCQAIFCPSIEGVRDGGTVICGVGSANEEPNRYGSECALVCYDGFRARGPTRTLCLGRGAWTETLGICERYRCFPPLLTPDSGTKVCSSDDDVIGSSCRFRCGDKTQLEGAAVVRCLDDGSWGGTAPFCVR